MALPDPFWNEIAIRLLKNLGVDVNDHRIRVVTTTLKAVFEVANPE